MSQPTEERFKKIEEEQRQLREEVRQLREQRTEEMKAINVNVGSQDVLDRLSDLKQELHTVSNTWLDTLQEHYDEHKEAISDVKTIQSGHAKFFEEHGKRLAATATKDDVSGFETTTNNRFDKVEGDIAELKGLIMQLIQQNRPES